MSTETKADDELRVVMCWRFENAGKKKNDLLYSLVDLVAPVILNQ